MKALFIGIITSCSICLAAAVHAADKGAKPGLKTALIYCENKSDIINPKYIVDNIDSNLRVEPGVMMPRNCDNKIPLGLLYREKLGFTFKAFTDKNANNLMCQIKVPKQSFRVDVIVTGLN